jgi:hypothetical protein
MGPHYTGCRNNGRFTICTHFAVNGFLFGHVNHIFHYNRQLGPL